MEKVGKARRKRDRQERAECKPRLGERPFPAAVAQEGRRERRSRKHRQGDRVVPGVGHPRRPQEHPGRDLHKRRANVLRRRGGHDQRRPHPRGGQRCRDVERMSVELPEDEGEQGHFVNGSVVPRRTIADEAGRVPIVVGGGTGFAHARAFERFRKRSVDERVERAPARDQQSRQQPADDRVPPRTGSGVPEHAVDDGEREREGERKERRHHQIEADLRRRPCKTAEKRGEKVAEIVVVYRFSGEPHVRRRHPFVPHCRVEEAEVHELFDAVQLRTDAAKEGPGKQTEQEEVLLRDDDPPFFP